MTRASVVSVQGPARVVVSIGHSESADGTPRTTAATHLHLGERSFRVDHLAATGVLSAIIPGREHRAWAERGSDAVGAIEAP